MHVWTFFLGKFYLEVYENAARKYTKRFVGDFVGVPCSRGTFYTPFYLTLLRKSAPTRARLVKHPPQRYRTAFPRKETCASTYIWLLIFHIYKMLTLANRVNTGIYEIFVVPHVPGDKIVSCGAKRRTKISSM